MQTHRDRLQGRVPGRGHRLGRFRPAGEPSRMLSASTALRRVRLTETVHALVTRGIDPAAVVEARTPH
ncbi:hypothetical protein ACFVZA_09830 [Streptomyces bottropensis]|uniref:hypothetical protein n=1 Tax=Streptomyces bottropensis TaxID=42235 RepID=UPI0036934697